MPDFYHYFSTDVTTLVGGSGEIRLKAARSRSAQRSPKTLLHLIPAAVIGVFLALGAAAPAGAGGTAGRYAVIPPPGGVVSQTYGETLFAQRRCAPGWNFDPQCGGWPITPDHPTDTGYNGPPQYNWRHEHHYTAPPGGPRPPFAPSMPWVILAIVGVGIGAGMLVGRHGGRQHKPAPSVSVTLGVDRGRVCITRRAAPQKSRVYPNAERSVHGG